MTYDCSDCMKRIKEQMRKNGMDIDRKLGNLEDYPKTIKKLMELGIIKKGEYDIAPPYSHRILSEDN